MRLYETDGTRRRVKEADANRVGARAGHREFRAALRVRCDGRLRNIEETGFSRIARRG